jgi:hypothetical protein
MGRLLMCGRTARQPGLERATGAHLVLDIVPDTPLSMLGFWVATHIDPARDDWTLRTSTAYVEGVPRLLPKTISLGGPSFPTPLVVIPDAIGANANGTRKRRRWCVGSDG